MTVAYEWCAEEVDGHGDIVELYFYGTRAAAEAHKPVAGGCAEVNLCLVRDVFNDGGVVDRQWAYFVTGGAVPAEFSGGAAVPAAFRKAAKRRTPA